MSTLAVIPARGGSKGIARKNLCCVSGKPLIAHAVENALAAKLVDRVIVSTDDEQIASVARACGADIVDRPQNISGDQATSESVVLHALDTLLEETGQDPEITLLIQCTSPLMKSEDIDGAIFQINEHGADSSFTAVKFHHFLWRQDDAHGMTGINHDESIRQRRQDISPEYLETGAVYAMRTSGFRESASGSRRRCS